MPRITVPAIRDIVDDFAKEIKRRLSKTARPSMHVINFRDDMQAGRERPVVKVPIELLRYRKHNGRITSDVLDYEKNIGPLDETDAESQKKLKEFLAAKAPEKTSILRKSIMHDGQIEPAIITCDGFLINGNRRKMVMEKLAKDYPGDEKYEYMKVVMLPGKDDEGGAPTIKEIEKIENRYQMQHSGKSEYYKFDRALSIKRKVEIGLSLKEQLLDDPVYANASDKELKRAEKQYKKDYLKPLECIDRYLRQFRRQGEYKAVSSGVGDPEGRWQAFYDWSNSLNNHFINRKKRIKMGVAEDEIGIIEEAAFNIIRLRKVPKMNKVHYIMRDFPKYCNTEDGKKAIMKIAQEVEPEIPHSECFDSDGNPLSPKDIDEKWDARYVQPITHYLHRAADIKKVKEEKDTPLDLLRAAYNKLNHEDMDLNKIPTSEHGTARNILRDIQDCAHYYENELFRYKKSQEKLIEKYSKERANQKKKLKEKCSKK